jgi:hypothetical protein
VAAETAAIRLELKEAELTEDWDKYAKLQATLTRIDGVTDVIDVEGEVFLHATHSDVKDLRNVICIMSPYFVLKCCLALAAYFINSVLYTVTYPKIYYCIFILLIKCDMVVVP